MEGYETPTKSTPTTTEDAGSPKESDARAVLQKLDENPLLAKNPQLLNMAKFGVLSGLSPNATPQGKLARQGVETFETVMQDQSTDPKPRQSLISATGLLALSYCDRSLKEIPNQTMAQPSLLGLDGPISGSTAEVADSDRKPSPFKSAGESSDAGTGMSLAIDRPPTKAEEAQQDYMVAVIQMADSSARSRGWDATRRHGWRIRKRLHCVDRPACSFAACIKFNVSAEGKMTTETL